MPIIANVVQTAAVGHVMAVLPMTGAMSMNASVIGRLLILMRMKIVASHSDTPVVLAPGVKATSADEPQTVDGWSVGPVTRSAFRGQVFGWLYQPDPRGYGIKGPTRWYMNGEPVDPDDPALKVSTIPILDT